MTTETPLPPRQDAVRDLVELRVPVAEAVRVLRRFPWDEDELVDLDVAHVTAALAAYDAGVLNAPDLEAWADAVEGRDDIGRTAGQEQLLNDVLMALSSPELFGGFGMAVASVRGQLGEPG